MFVICCQSVLGLVLPSYCISAGMRKAMLPQFNHRHQLVIKKEHHQFLYEKSQFLKSSFVDDLIQ